MASTSKQISSPDSFHSCEDSNDYKDLFINKDDYIENDEIKIDHKLSDAISFVNYDSEMTIAAFPGCLRIGKVFKCQLISEDFSGLNNQFLIEIPIFILNKFIREFKNCLNYVYNKNNPKINEEKKIGEVKHNIFLFSKKFQDNETMKFSFLTKQFNETIYEITFFTTLMILHFTKSLFPLLLDTTMPQYFQQEITILLLRKFDSKPEKQIQILFDKWGKYQKLEILWNAISEVVFEKEKKECKDLKIKTFNFIKRNLPIIEAMNHLFKFSNTKS